jgi:hypothetical protein
MMNLEVYTTGRFLETDFKFFMNEGIDLDTLISTKALIIPPVLSSLK